MNRRKTTIGGCIIAAIALSTLAACSHKLRFTPRDKDKLFIRRIIRMEGTDLLDNLDQWNLKANVKNLFPGPVLFYISEVKCFKGEVQGELDIRYYPDNAMAFRRGQVRKLAFRCQFPSNTESSGRYRIVIPRIFHNPLGDKITTDKVIAKNIEWKIKPGADI